MKGCNIEAVGALAATKELCFGNLALATYILTVRTGGPIAYSEMWRGSSRAFCAPLGLK